MRIGASRHACSSADQRRGHVSAWLRSQKIMPTRLPGFSGEASLYNSHHSYVRGLDYAFEAAVHPATYVDQACLSHCLRDCGSECAGTSGSGKSLCIHECAHDNLQCRSSCTRPGNPPGQSSSQPTCTVQDSRRCFLFGIPFLPVSPGTFGAVCSGSCTKTCCTESGDQRLCGVSPC